MSLHALAAVLLLLASLAPAADGEWASFRADSRNSATATGTGYQVYQDVWWNNKTGGNAQVKASPVLKDGILVVADLGARTETVTVRGNPTTRPVANPVGVVRALDAESGTELWRHTMTGPVESTPAIAGERVYVADAKGVLRALNLRNGAVEHEYRSHGPTLAPITLHENKLFLGTEAGEMKAYLASTLTPLWTFKVSEYGVNTASYGRNEEFTGCKGSTQHPTFSPQPIRSAPAVFDKKVFFGSMNHYVFAVDEEGLGNLKTVPMWVHKTGDVVVGAPSVITFRSDFQSEEEHRVVVGSYDGKLYAFDPSPEDQGEDPCYGVVHEPSWTYQVPNAGTQVSKIHSSPASANQTIVFGANNGKVYGVHASGPSDRDGDGDQDPMWEATAGSTLTPVTSSPVVANGVVVVGSEDKNVYWLDARDGRVLKTFATESAVVTSPAIDGVRAFIASQDGTIYMFGPEIPRRPDLAVESVTAITGGLNVVVRNDLDARQRGAASGNTTLRLFVEGTFLANLPVPSIDPGSKTTVRYTGPYGTAAVTVRALADADSAVQESNESNNELSRRVAPPTTTTGSDDEGEGGGGIRIPGPGAALAALAVLAAVALAGRRRP